MYKNQNHNINKIIYKIKTIFTLVADEQETKIFSSFASCELNLIQAHADWLKGLIVTYSKSNEVTEHLNLNAICSKGIYMCRRLGIYIEDRALLEQLSFFYTHVNQQIKSTEKKMALTLTQLQHICIAWSLKSRSEGCHPLPLTLPLLFSTLDIGE